MRLINKKSLILLTSILLVIISVLVIKQTKPIELDEVKLLESSNNTSFAMYKKTDNGYEEYQAEMFPHGYTLNLDESKCIDSNGNEIKDSLKYEHNQVTLISNKTSYCYLYFDEKENISNICNGTNMQECLSNKKEGLVTIENLSTELKGNMYRYQGLATDVDNNYICFGTNKEEDCINNPGQYMYRIIGIEESGRIKVIKKEALDQTYQWYTDYVTDVKLPNSVFFQAINGDDFLNNETYFPSAEWKNKISDNNWLYGDMWDDDGYCAKQEPAGLYETETGQKATIWYIKLTKEDGGTQSTVGWEKNEVYPQGTIFYYTILNEKWTDTIPSKISLMNLSDYSYSVGDEAKCNFFYGEEEYSKCKLGWMHLSNNDLETSNYDEGTMSRFGWDVWSGAYFGFLVNSDGYTTRGWALKDKLSIRPVFYINANQIIKSGIGAIDNPYILQ